MIQWIPEFLNDLRYLESVKLSVNTLELWNIYILCKQEAMRNSTCTVLTPADKGDCSYLNSSHHQNNPPKWEALEMPMTYVFLFYELALCEAEKSSSTCHFSEGGAGDAQNLERFRYPCLGKLYLSWAKVDEPVSVYCALYAMRCTTELLRTSLAWAKREYKQYKLLETRPAILCTHTIRLICSPTRENRSSFSSQAGP